MLTVKVRYFAALREAAGASHESLATSSIDLNGLYGELAEKYGFGLRSNQMKASLNGNWVDLSAVLSEGDEVVFIPPVAGG